MQRQPHFFFENQLRKYTEEIESVMKGMGNLKKLDDERKAAIEKQQQLELDAQNEYAKVRQDIDATKASYREEKDKLIKEVSIAYEELQQMINRVQTAQQQLQSRIEDEMSEAAVEHVELEYKKIENEQRATGARLVDTLTEQKARLNQSEIQMLSHEQVMDEVKNEMDRIMRRLRAIDQAELN